MFERLTLYLVGQPTMPVLVNLVGPPTMPALVMYLVGPPTMLVLAVSGRTADNAGAVPVPVYLIEW